MMSTYFFSNITAVSLKSQEIQERKERQSLPFDIHALDFTVGDVLVLVFWNDGLVYKFEGMCLAVRGKQKITPDVTILLCNRILGVGISVTASYFYNRLFYLTFSDYKRKKFIYKRSKIYFIKSRLNKQTRIKA